MSFSFVRVRYDFFTVAPREWFQCADPIVPEGNERWPENAYWEYQINRPLKGEAHWREPDAIMIFKWLKPQPAGEQIGLADR